MLTYDGLRAEQIRNAAATTFFCPAHGLLSLLQARLWARGGTRKKY
jgi:hypothetical protein